MKSMRICAVIPAAGRGTRLGSDCPKILVPVKGKSTIWNILRDLLMPRVEHIHAVLSPLAEPLFQSALLGDPEHKRISTSIQQIPLGMGDAIFGAHAHWADFDILLIVWGDQVNLSANTLEQVINACGKERALVLPLTQLESPYVQYDIEGSHLIRVRQKREGDLTDAKGLSDVGLFALSVKGLTAHWREFLENSNPGAHTGEINFLPFLPFLSSVSGFTVKTVPVDDPVEARGVNTPEDLQFAKARLTARH
jgi:bifunctional UDP-N-acetylglucosamine pyrophosphorylase / glucosamine-1-phosphate N-acetyltransferase